MLVRTFILSAGVLLLAATAFAQPSGRRGPPPEAAEVCENKSEGETCSFAAPHGEVTGQCRTPPNHDALVCVPDGPPPKR